MLSFHLLAATVVTLLVTPPTFGQAPARVRGSITAIKRNSLTVMERDGRIFTLKTVPATAYAYVIPATLDAIRVNDFVGSAVKGPPSSMIAVELAIIPENMRAGRISFYPWDPLPDPTARDTSERTATSMTNGLVSNVSPGPANDSVLAGKGGMASRTLTVTYNGGSKSFRIAVPPKAPIVRYVLSDRSAVVIGSIVMIKTNSGDRAGLVTVGKGVVPPM